MFQVVWQRGFRPLFVLASLFALLAIAAWASMLAFPRLEVSPGIPPHLWHAHEMIYGYTFAVIAGFLLTAVRNWTDSETASPRVLQLLCLSWLTARIAWLAGADFLLWAMLADAAFTLILLGALLRPIVRKRQWRQSAIMGKVLMLGMGNALFYLALSGAINMDFSWSLQGAIYVIIALILTIARRVFPFFIERGIDGQVKLFNARWLDLSSLIVFVLFFVSELVLNTPFLAHSSAALMGVIVIIRMLGWYDRRIWSTPILWSLHASLGLIALGFFLHSLQGWVSISPFLPLHALAMGGIGTLTASMMARVSIGHTGRNLRQPPTILHLTMVLLIAGCLIRSLAPLAFPHAYMSSLMLASFCWVLGFGLLAFTIVPMLLRARPDGKPG